MKNVRFLLGAKTYHTKKNGVDRVKTVDARVMTNIQTNKQTNKRDAIGDGLPESSRSKARKILKVICYTTVLVQSLYDNSFQRYFEMCKFIYNKIDSFTFF